MGGRSASSQRNPMKGFSTEVFDSGPGTKWEWKVKNRQDVTVARSPKKYKTVEEAREGVRLFVEAIG